MASVVAWSRTPLSIVKNNTICRRLPIVSAICVLSFGISNLCLFRPGCSQSLPFAPLLRSKAESKGQFKSIHSARMTEANTTVPSIVVYVTVPNKEAGKKLAGSIVKERLAACVNRVPGVESIYEWNGEIQTDTEELLIIKTRESLLGALTEHIKANHEYDVPEVIAMPITGGNAQYLEWLKNSTKN